MADDPRSKAPEHEPNKQYSIGKEYTGTLGEVNANVRGCFYYMITPDSGQGVNTDQQARVETSSGQTFLYNGDKVIFKFAGPSWGEVRKA